MKIIIILQNLNACLAPRWRLNSLGSGVTMPKDTYLNGQTSRLFLLCSLRAWTAFERVDAKGHLCTSNIFFKCRALNFIQVTNPIVPDLNTFSEFY